MASGSQSMTTYYAKRIVGDASAAQANSALLQTGANVTADTWILNRTNRATIYGIKYVYDTTTTTVHNDENDEDITTNNGQDKIEFYGGSATASAWIQLNTGDTYISGRMAIGGINDSYKLYVNGSARIDSLLTLYREGSTTDNNGTGIRFENKDTTTNKIQTAGKTYILAYNTHSADDNGMNMVIRPGGNLFIGSGESAEQLYSLNTTSTTENLYATADSTIYLEAGAQTIANRIGIAIDDDGTIIPVKAEADNNDAQNIGTDATRWKTGYFSTSLLVGAANSATAYNSDASGSVITDGTISICRTTAGGGYYLFANGKQYGRIYISAIGTANSGDDYVTRGAQGYTTLQLGNNIPRPTSGTEGGADNSRGRLLLYHTDDTYTTIDSGSWTGHNLTVIGTTSGTANETGTSMIIIGNSYKKSAAAASSTGYLRIFGDEQYYHNIYPGASTDNHTHYLPNASGWIVTGGNGTNTGEGDIDTPVYLKTDGTLEAITSYDGNSATATKLSNTPNNTTTFLRGDNTWTNTLTGTFYSSGSPGFQNVTAAGTWAYLQLKSGTLGWDIASISSQNSGALDFRPHKSTNHGIMISQDGGLYFRNPATDGIYYAGTKATHRMIRFIDNASDTYGNGIGIGGGGLVVIGAGESSDTLLSNLSLTSSGGTETTYITSDGSIEFYPSINGWDATARIWMTAGVLNIGLDGNSPRENSLNVYGGAGRIQLYSAASTTGNRGLWIPAHGSGSAKNIILIDTNNNITFNGNVTGNCSGSSGSCTGNATTCSYPLGFSSRGTGETWGNTTGTGIAVWSTSTGGAISFRNDNPSSGKLSVKVDGRFYGNEGTYPTMLMRSENGYWGLCDPDAANNVWIRTTTQGIIPYQSGGAGSGHGGLGTSSWYFSAAYIDNIYGKLNGNCTGSSGSCTGNAATATTASNLTNFQTTTTSSSGLEVTTNGITYVSGLTKAAWNYQQTDGVLYSQFYNASWKHQIFGDYRTGQISVRGKNNGTWQAWRNILDSSNYTSYAADRTAITNISRSGTTFTATRANGTTFTFTQQDNNTTYSFSDKNVTLAWGTKSTIATVGGTDIHVTMPANPNTNTWRPVQNNLTSTSTSDCLSAAQGKALNDKINAAISSNVHVTYFSSNTTVANNVPCFFFLRGFSSDTRAGGIYQCLGGYDAVFIAGQMIGCTRSGNKYTFGCSDGSWVYGVKIEFIL